MASGVTRVLCLPMTSRNAECLASERRSTVSNSRSGLISIVCQTTSMNSVIRSSWIMRSAVYPSLESRLRRSTRLGRHVLPCLDSDSLKRPTENWILNALGSMFELQLDLGKTREAERLLTEEILRHPSFTRSANDSSSLLPLLECAH